MNTILYGISNCDTVRKARKWLDTKAIDYCFHDFRKDGLEIQQLEQWTRQLGWEVLLNRRGTTWRQLSGAEREGIDAARALALMVAQPTLIKRPVLQLGATLEVGFDAGRYQMLFN